jgi:hypothetical protein
MKIIPLKLVVVTTSENYRWPDAACFALDFHCCVERM